MRVTDNTEFKLASTPLLLLTGRVGTGQEQMRRRRFWFGVWGEAAPELRGHIDFALTADGLAQSVTGRNSGEIGVTGGHRGSPARYTLDEMLDLQAAFLPEFD